MNQQCSSMVNILSNVSAFCHFRNLCPQSKSLLINRMINDRLLDADQPSFGHCLISSICCTKY